MHSDWLKLVTRLATFIYSSLFHRNVRSNAILNGADDIDLLIAYASGFDDNLSLNHFNDLANGLLDSVTRLGDLLNFGQLYKASN